MHEAKSDLRRPAGPRPCRWWACTLVLLACILAGDSRAGQFTYFFVELVDAGESGDCKALADLDGDGLDDAVIGGYELIWYRAPEWTANVIAVADLEFTTDMAAGDVDGDGDVDVVIPDGTAGVYWFENGDAGVNWTRHFIAPTGGGFCHDVELGDLDGDGDLDAVGRWPGNGLFVFRQDSDGWSTADMTTTDGEGLALADLDQDGRLDIVVNGQWHRAPAGDVIGDAWSVHTYAADRLSERTKVAAADLNGDGRPDVALTPSEEAGEIAWYAAPADPTGDAWPLHVLQIDADHFHSLQLVDLDGDGDRDLLTAQMHTAVSNPVVAAYLNPGGSDEGWTLEVISNASSHNLAVGDVNGDRRIDLLGCDYIGHPPVLVWRNETTAAASASPPPPSLTLTATPNPFNAQIALTVEGGGAQTASLRLYDIHGGLVRELFTAATLLEPRTITWDGRDGRGRAVPAGVYFAVLATDAAAVTRKLVLVE